MLIALRTTIFVIGIYFAPDSKRNAPFIIYMFECIDS